MRIPPAASREHASPSVGTGIGTGVGTGLGAGIGIGIGTGTGIGAVILKEAPTGRRRPQEPVRAS